MHITSFEIDASYSIAMEQQRNEGSEATREYLRAKCKALGVTNNVDKIGFYMGSNLVSLGLIDLLLDSEQHKQTFAKLDLFILYESYIIPTDVLQTSLSTIPVIEERLFGALTYAPCEMNGLDLSLIHI